MGSYVKIWTDLLYDPWFLGLPLIEKGMWFILIVFAKHHGDTGQVSFASWRGMGSACGCDGKTCKKILTSFRSQNKIGLKENLNGTILIEIVKYEHYQRVKTVKDRKKEVVSKPISAEKSPQHPHYKIRQDKIKEDNNKRVPADEPPTKLKADPTYRKTIDRLIAEIYRFYNLKLDYDKAGLFYKKAESYGQAIVAIRRAWKKIKEQNQQMDKFIPYVFTELKPESRKYWSGADWEEVKGQNQALDTWLNRECGETIGDVFRKLGRK